MNIFFLDQDPKTCAKYHCDKHVVKMILESVQLLYTACWLTFGKMKLKSKKVPETKSEYPKWLETAPFNKSGTRRGYKATHQKHPCVLWVCESIANYRWLCQLADELCQEYTYRYHKTHNSYQHVVWLKENEPLIPNIGMTTCKLAMPDEYKIPDDPVESYRTYYLKDKRRFAVYTGREVPSWLKYNITLTRKIDIKRVSKKN